MFDFRQNIGRGDEENWLEFYQIAIKEEGNCIHNKEGKQLYTQSLMANQEETQHQVLKKMNPALTKENVIREKIDNRQ